MSNYLVHSAKGSTWSNHKYISKVGNKYFYPKDTTEFQNKQQAVKDVGESLQVGKDFVQKIIDQSIDKLGWDEPIVDKITKANEFATEDANELEEKGVSGYLKEDLTDNFKVKLKTGNPYRR